MDKPLSKLSSACGWGKCAILLFGVMAAIIAFVFYRIFHGTGTPLPIGFGGYYDEAWMLLLIKARQSVLGSSFASYLSFLSDWNMLEIRRFVSYLSIIKYLLLSCSFLYYFRNRLKLKLWQKILIVLFCIYGSSLAWTGTGSPYPEYRGIASFFCLTAYSLMIFAIAEGTPVILSRVFIAVSGILMAQLAFTLPQTLVIIPFLLYFLWRRARNDGLVCLLGGILGVVLFFVFVQSPADLIANFQTSAATAVKASTNSHGLKMGMLCYAKILADYCSVIFPLGFALYGCSRIQGVCRRMATVAVMLIMFCNFGLSALRAISWQSPSVPAFSVLVIIGLLVYQWLDALEKKSDASKDAWLIFFTLLIATAFCTMTDVGFASRLTGQMPIVYLTIIMFAFIRGDRLVAFCLAILLVMELGSAFVYSKRAPRSRPDIVASEQVGLPPGAILSKERASMIQTIMQKCGNCSYLATDEFFWDLPYLMHKTPLILRSFRYYSRADMAERIHELNLKATDIAFLETPVNALDDERLQAIQNALKAERYEKIKVAEEATLICFE